MTRISGESKAYYTVTDADYGCYIRVVAIGSGSYTGYFASVETEVPVSTFEVSVSNQEPGVGDTVSAVMIPNAATADYQWYRVDGDGVETAIAGATSKSYVVTGADVGFYLKVTAAGTGDYDGLSAEATTTGTVISLAVTLGDVDPEVGLERIRKNRTWLDRLDQESVEFHERVLEGYREVIERYRDRMIIIDANRSADEVINDAYMAVKGLLDA